MWAPLAVLAVLSLVGGFLSVPHWLEPMFHEKEVHVDALIANLPFVAGFLGIALAYLFYVAKPSLAESFKKSMGGLYTLVYNKYFVDEAYDLTVVEPLMQGSKTVLWRGMDAGLIDGMANGVGSRARGLGNVLRLLQSGSIRNYAAWVVFGSVILLLAVGFAGGVR
jgi:NADH-quinone oxidoreductase subunit L